MKRIGIVGGLGAAAGARMLDLVVKEYQRRGATRDDEFPEMLLHSMSSRGLDERGVADRARLRADLTCSIEMLNGYGVDTILIACNSAYEDYEYLQSISRATVLNMVEIAVATATKGARRVGVITSASTKNCALYASALTARGVEIVQTTDKQQRIIDRVIARVIAGKQGYDTQCELATVVQCMQGDGAERIILGCT